MPRVLMWQKPSESLSICASATRFMICPAVERPTRDRAEGSGKGDDSRSASERLYSRSSIGSSTRYRKSHSTSLSPTSHLAELQTRVYKQELAINKSRGRLKADRAGTEKPFSNPLGLNALDVHFFAPSRGMVKSQPLKRNLVSEEQSSCGQ
jgi:hypothetical protein